MEYAITLNFDAKTETAFNKLVEKLTEAQPQNYALEHNIPPHVTIAFFCTEHIDKVAEKLDANIALFSTGTVTWASLGSFVPKVLFAAPVLDDYLRNACVTANRLVQNISEVGDEGHYLPNQWVPHTALLYRASQDELTKAFDIAARHFTPINGTSNRLILAQCSPYKELKTWALL